MHPRSAARTFTTLLLGTLLMACQTVEPPEVDPSLPPPAPITPPPQTMPTHGQVVTAPLPGKPERPPPAPARLSLRDAQALLNGMGYDAGPADGVAGRRTTAALRAFQSEHGLPATGKLDDATRQALRPR